MMGCRTRKLPTWPARLKAPRACTITTRCVPSRSFSMNDCPNADVRDLLPDRLDEAARAMVESHLEGCADCRAELALLRDVRASLRRAPALNVAAIAAAIPAYHAPVRRS